MSSRYALPESRLPRAPRQPSSPDGFKPNTLKRKATDETVEAPSKLRALANSDGPKPQPLRESNRQGIAAAPAIRPAKPLSRSDSKPLPEPAPAPKNVTQRKPRGGSAPPIKVRPVTGIVHGKRTTPEPGMGRSGMRTVSGPSRRIEPVAEERYQELRTQFDSLSAIVDAEREKVADITDFRSKIQNELGSVKEMEIRRGMIAAADELDDMRRRHGRELQTLQDECDRKDKELDEARDILREQSADLDRERETSRTLKASISEQANANLLLEAQVTSLRARCDALSTEGQAHQSSRAQLAVDLKARDVRIAELEEELCDAESLRRKLHNQIQELKGNIRVFCRVRPPLPHEQSSTDDLASMRYPDRKEHKEIVLSSTTETAMGSTRDSILPFSFDRVFEPPASQAEVFEEISHLVQSCIDGYNVCIFAYGQTGSGKSFTMEGGSDEQSRGMIPRAVHHVFAAADGLRKKGWEYKMEGQFLEIYNETIVDLLGRGNEGKHEIKHDKGKTTVTDVVVYPLRSPDKVQNLLSHAQSRRTVHATLMNERSSRSHSVFTLRVNGTNSATGETCEGSLNLVDLAGSERIEKSGAQNDKDRLKEAQAINKSLSSLGDVIAALGEKNGSNDKHVPYRNSKLTYLLQNSLGGNSKTLMFVNVSPLADHYSETVCSLRFATKVNNTTIGTARKQQAR